MSSLHEHFKNLPLSWRCKGSSAWHSWKLPEQIPGQKIVNTAHTLLIVPGMSCRTNNLNGIQSIAILGNGKPYRGPALFRMKQSKVLPLFSFSCSSWCTPSDATTGSSSVRSRLENISSRRHFSLNTAWTGLLGSWDRKNIKINISPRKIISRTHYHVAPIIPNILLSPSCKLRFSQKVLYLDPNAPLLILMQFPYFRCLFDMLQEYFYWLPFWRMAVRNKAPAK